MDMLRKIVDALTGQANFTMAEPGYDPMEEPARASRKSMFGCAFWLFLFLIVGSTFFAIRGYQQQWEEETRKAIAENVRLTESAYTSTPTITTTPRPTGSPFPTATATATITTTPATATSTPTATLTPQPKIIYQDRTIVITVQVPWIITQIVKETVIVVVTATPTFTPSPTLSATPTLTPTPNGSTATATPTIYY